MANFFPVIMYGSVLSLNLYSLIYFMELGYKMKKSGREKEFGEDIADFAGFEFCFFTLWNFIFQILFMIVAIMDEVSKLMKFSLITQKRLGKTRAVMYNTILFPSTLMVMSIFWILWHTDRELVFPEILDLFFPSWLNHMLHTFIVMPIIIELILPKKYNFVKFEKSAVVLTAIFMFYQILYFSIYFCHGVWLYAVYKVFTWPQRIMFTACQFVMVLSYQKLGIMLQNCKKPSLRQKFK
ncbi:androgen-dependent TFPI-regulating protein-like [Diorhabda carinulata]|uniref:androgen-dependent TFPI-regulating protein-like n=1 Tax=Diorhabda carinulata TaxID=1163345 RepID=UPI0025A0B863|nr:androgen-dependent TFPI-regulating protein-like [Diorhabda carinulata]